MDGVLLRRKRMFFDTAIPGKSKEISGVLQIFRGFMHVIFGMSGSKAI